MYRSSTFHHAERDEYLPSALYAWGTAYRHPGGDYAPNGHNNLGLRQGYEFG